MTRDERLPGSRPIVCLVTDRRRIAPDAGPADLGPLVAQVEAAARAGVDLVQVRERDLQAGQLATLVLACLAAVRGSAARVLVNDRLDVALAAGAHGVHLRGDSMAPERVRAAVPAGFLVGRSVHAEDEAVALAATSALDYLIFGALFRTRSKPAGHRSAGLEALERVVRSVAVPVLGIGGIDGARLPAVARTGAAGFAGIDYFAVPRDDERGAALGALGLAVAEARRGWAAGWGGGASEAIP